MRFQQLMKQSNAILKKKMYKSGKNWVVKSTLSIAGGLALFGVSQVNVVKADDVNNQVIDIQDQDIQGQDVQNQYQVNSGVEGKQGAVSQSTAHDDSSKLDNVPSDGVNEKDGIDSKADIPATPVKSESVPVEKTGVAGQSTPQNNLDNPDGTQTSPDNQYSGKLGTAEDAATWKVENGTNLVISGGTMDNVTLGVSPWGSEETTQYLKDNIIQVDFDNDWITYAGESISGMFQDFSKLVTVNNIGSFDISKTKDFSYLYSGCKNLVATDRDPGNLNDAPYFYSRLIVGDYDNINYSHMFSGDTSLRKIQLSPTISGVTHDVSSMFEGDTSLKYVDMGYQKMSPSTISSNLFKGANNIKELILNESTNLTNSGLDVGLRNQENLNKGITGWIVYGSNNNTIENGTIKNTNELINTYTGDIGSDGNHITWYNYDPYVLKFVSTDTNGKELGTPLSGYIPIEMNADMTTFKEKLKELKENGSIVPNDSGSDSGSRIFRHVDGQKDTVTPITSDILDQGDFYDLVDQSIDEITSDILDSNYANGGNIIYLVFPPKKNTNSSSGGSSTSREIEGIEERISTYAEKPEVQLYDDNGSILTDRKLAPNSDWYTDESMQLNKDKYYRVATNQWAKANDVYLYYPSASKVQVNAGTTATLVTDEGKTVTDRALQPLSNWYTDKYIYINGVKYYRVATNEFVSANQVVEY